MDPLARLDLEVTTNVPAATAEKAAKDVIRGLLY
jgi:hypothetical protein